MIYETNTTPYINNSISNTTPYITQLHIWNQLPYMELFTTKKNKNEKKSAF